MSGLRCGVLYACLCCGEVWDAEGRWREGYEPGETEFVPDDGECPNCFCREIEAV